jgi:hypothetical protein
LKRLGLQLHNAEDVHYRVWKATSSTWTLAEADYDHLVGSELTICQIVVIFDRPSELHSLREVRCQKTDADVPTLTTWSPIDIADVNGDGRDEIVLEGDAYEDHWLEVVSVGDNLSSRTIFSGLGYYL